MASIHKRGKHQYRVLIRRGDLPKPMTKTFASAEQARAWAREIETQLDHGNAAAVFGNKEASRMTLHEALEKYLSLKTPRKLSWRNERNLIRHWQRHALARRPLTALDSSDFAQYRDQRLVDGLALSTVRKELNLISNLFNVARMEWKMRGLPNPLADVKKPPAWVKPTTRRFNDPTERERLYAELQNQAKFTNKKNRTVRFYTIKAIQFALETGLRRGEACGLLWKDVHLDDRYIQVVRPAHQNAGIKGGDREVPLSSAALAILRQLPPAARKDERVFPVAPSVLTRVFYEARRAAGLSDDLKFHTMRHEATSSFMERGLNPVEVANITGHASLDTMRRYTHPARLEVLKKLG